jgi:hypothetical protein
MTDEKAYALQRREVSESDLASWTVNDVNPILLLLNGTCPECQHRMGYLVRTTTVFQQMIRLGQMTYLRQNVPIELEVDRERTPELDESLTTKIACNCEQVHSGRDDSKTLEGERGCGRYWFSSLQPQDDGTRKVFPAANPYLIEAARTARSASHPELMVIRTAAEKWIGGVTALLGVFTLTGVITGADDVAKLGGKRFTPISNWTLLPFWELSFVVLAVMATIFAALAIFASYKAAYGWPKSRDVKNDEQLGKLYQEWLNAPKTAADSLRLGAQLAAVALAFVVITLLVLWLAPRQESGGTLIKIEKTDESQVCGEPLKSTSAGELRVRARGNPQTVKLSEISKVDGVGDCP